MMGGSKSLFLILAIAIVFSAVGAYAGPGPIGMDAVGIFGSFIGNTTGDTGASLGLTARWGSFPIVGISYMFASNGFNLGAAVDYWATNLAISGTALHYFLGVGLFGGIAVRNSKLDPDFGLRVPIGLQIFPVKKFEIFIEGVPMIGFLPTVLIKFGADLGLRVYF
jgi:hypothetical protein